MTEAVCYRDAYARSLEATVRAVDPAPAGGPPDGGSLVVLDRTVFYPGGGGQPSDRGLLLRAADGRRWVVRSARKSERRDRPRARAVGATSRRWSATGSRSTSTGRGVTP